MAPHVLEPRRLPLVHVLGAAEDRNSGRAAVALPSLDAESVYQEAQRRRNPCERLRRLLT